MARKACVMTASSVRNGHPLTEQDKKEIFENYVKVYCQLKGIEDYIIFNSREEAEAYINGE